MEEESKTSETEVYQDKALPKPIQVGSGEDKPVNEKPKVSRFSHDKWLASFSYRIFVAYVILLILFVVAAVITLIVWLANDSTLCAVGFFSCIVAAIALTAVYWAFMAVIDRSIDIKYIRNKLYNEDNKEVDEIRDLFIGKK